MKKSSFHKIFLFGLLIFPGTHLFSQVFSSRIFNEGNGLAQKFIFSVTQDKNGVLILGTEKGVVTFNGDQFVTYNTADGLAEDQVSCVFSESSGRINVGHFEKGISRIDNGKAGIVDSSGNVNGRINSLAEDPAGNVWGISEGKGIFRIRKNNLKPEFPKGGNSSATILAFDSSGQLLTGGSSGLNIYNIKPDGSVSPQVVLPETQDKNVQAFCSGKLSGSELLFVALEGEGIYCYTRNGKNYRLLFKLTNELNCRDMNFSSIVCDQTNNLWVGTMGEGLRKITFDNYIRPSQVQSYSSATGLPDENIKSLLVDLENNLWVGTFGHGLLEIPYSAFRFYTRSNGLLKQEVNCVVRDENGAFWLGNNNGITCFRKNDPQSTEFFDDKNGFSSQKVTCLAEDHDGRIWIGTSGDGIFLLDPLKKSFENISKRENLESDIINTITVTGDDRVLFGTTDGLYILRKKENRFIYYTTLDGLMHNNIQQLYTDADNNVWFSSAGTPPYWLRNEEITSFHQIDKLRTYNINGIYQDRNRVCWIATDGDGIFSYDGTNFRQYTPRNGLKSSNCIDVIADNQNLIWVVHKSGLSLKFPDDSVFYSFSASDNLLFDDINPFVYKDRDGSIFLSSNYGLIEISNQNKDYIRRDPKISLAKLYINGTEKLVKNEIALPPGNYNLSFEFNNILFSVPYSLPFYYRIIGADSVWRLATGRNIVIPQLSSGNYILQVSSSKTLKSRKQNAFEIYISIDKPFWQKTWFVLLAILLTPLIILGLIRLQTISLVRLNKRLQFLVHEKTSQLQEEKEAVSRINNELESKNKDITDSIHYAKRIQLAILPDIEILKEQFPRSFIYYLPRDIVSGDFYWFANKGPLFIIAAVDCTGHGIPGAFMSMIGTTLLNKVVFDYNITKPAEILQQLNSEITSSLHQSDVSGSSHDGMDIALCVIDKSKNKLTFSGAGRPLFMVRNHEVLTYKTNKSGIGGVYNSTSPVYEEIEIPLEKSDSVYLFSDGCTDQFGYESGSKFSTKRMRELLKEIGHLPMDQQETIIRRIFTDWKGHGEQFDDMLFMGFKVE
jgi:ligand-binding sensor domain-containing protein/serine phosphatase RsbU (regulator of sigma subunit)